MAKLIEITGKALSGEWGSDDTNGIGIPVLRTTNFTNEGVVNYQNVVTRIITKPNISEKYLRSDDIIIEKSGGSDKQPVGRVIYYDGPENAYLFNNFTGLLRVKDPSKWFPKYTFYALFANYWRGGTRRFENKTTGLHNLKIDDYVSRFEIPEVPLDQQMHICDMLDKVHSLIDSRKQQLTELDNLIKARFVEMFGDPVCNEMCWEQRPLSVCLESIDNGKSFVCDSVARESDWPAVLKLSAATYGFYRPEENKAMLDKNQFIEDAAVRVGDLLFTRKNTPELVGMCAYVYDTPGKLMMPDLIFRLNTTERCNKVFLWKLINHDLFRDCVQAIATGSAKSMSNISKERLLGLEIILPPIELQNQFAAFVEQTDKSKVVVQKALDEAQTLFDSLMQEFFG